ncbi:MAG: DUF167 family protein [Desulfurococcaceae archaeon]
MPLSELRESILRAIRKNLSETGEGVTLIVRVETGSNESYLTIEGDELVFKTRETSESKLNAVLVGFLSRELRIPSSRIDVVYGHRSHIKRLLVRDVGIEDLEGRLLRAIKLI